MLGNGFYHQVGSVAYICHAAEEHRAGGYRGKDGGVYVQNFKKYGFVLILMTLIVS